MCQERVLGFSRYGSPVSPPHPLSVAGFHSGLYYALRKQIGKTVMLLQNSRVANGAGLEPSEERRTLDHLFSMTYEELRRLASSVKRGDQGQTLNPTALVNEAWVKLANSPDFDAASHLHFKRIAARAMRQVLVEAARRRSSQKRGGDEEVTVITFDESLMSVVQCGNELLALDGALEELAKLNPRQALMVENRFFGGFEINEIAEMLNVSEATVMRDWRAAKAWLANELRHGMNGNKQQASPE